MKKVLTSVLFVTIVLCLFSCSDAIPSNNSENDSYFAVRVGTTDGDYFKEDENFIHDSKLFVDEDVKKQRVFSFNEKTFNLEYVNSDNYVYNERQRYRLNTPNGELEAKFFTDSGELAWFSIPKTLTDAPETFRSESEFREWAESFLKKFGINDMSGYTINYKTDFVYSVPGKTSSRTVDSFYIPEPDSNVTVSFYVIMYTYAIDGVDTSDRYEFLFNTEKDGRITVFLPNASFDEYESCPLDMEKADKALDDYVKAYLNTTIYELDSYDVTQKTLTIINGELACEYDLSIELTRDGWGSTRTTLLSVAVFPDIPEDTATE